MYQSRLVTISLVLLLASLTTGHALIAAENPNAPTPYDVSFTINPGDAPASCNFPLQVHLEGLTKTIDFQRQHRDIMIFPSSTATLTNLTDPSKEVTLSLTGSFHDQTEPDGSILTKATGRNLLGDPKAGLVLAIGNFSYVLDSTGNLIQPLAGHGQLVDVCTLVQ